MDTRFIFNPATDDSVDDEYVLIGTPITIQCCLYGGGYAVNEWFEEEQAMQDHGIFRSLKAAKAKALTVAGKTS